MIRSFLILAALHQNTAHCQEVKWTDLPAPQLEALEDVHSYPLFAVTANFPTPPNLVRPPPPELKPPSPRHARAEGRERSRFALDRPVLILGLVQGTSALYDGFTTKYFLHHCSSCVEVDPLSHFLLGSKPTWGGMIAAGSLETIATAYLHQSMRRSPHKFLRSVAPLVPLVSIGIHLIEGSRNLPLKNLFYCTTPGYVVVGSVCILPPSVAGSSSPAHPTFPKGFGHQK